jgi:predicted glutamine amidotransferase
MCVIVYKPANKSISYSDLKAMWNTNPDGVGIVVLSNKTTIYKGYLNFKQFYKQFQRVESQELFVHFRLGTSATVHSRNCHPFIVQLKNHPKHYLMHNGIIFDYGSKKITDTEDYIQKVLNKESSIIGVINKLENIKGKFVLFDDAGNFYTIGELQEYKGLWCSNLYFSFDKEDWTYTCK